MSLGSAFAPTQTTGITDVFADVTDEELTDLVRGSIVRSKLNELERQADLVSRAICSLEEIEDELDEELTDEELDELDDLEDALEDIEREIDGLRAKLAA